MQKAPLMGEFIGFAVDKQQLGFDFIEEQHHAGTISVDRLGDLAPQPAPCSSETRIIC
jgi:hypothetical protein